MTATPALPEADVIGAEMMARLDALAAHSEAGEGLTRRFASPEHRAAAALILGWMRDAGMATHMDAVGNCVGRYEGGAPGLPGRGPARRPRRLEPGRGALNPGGRPAPASASGTPSWSMG